MNLRRWSLGLSVVGAAVWVAAATYLVSVGWGETSTTTATPGGGGVTETHRTASAYENDPAQAVRMVLIVLAASVVAVLLIRFGGYVGPMVVIGITGLGTFAAMLTIGIFIAPGTACMGAAALLAIIDRAQPPPSPTPGIRPPGYPVPPPTGGG